MHNHIRQACAGTTALILITLGAPTLAMEHSSLCPPQIHTDQKLQRFVAEWNAVSLPTRNVLVTIEIFEGVPSERVSLVYDGDKRLSGGKDLFRWHLDAHKQYWIQCEYFGTSVGLQKALRVGTKRCDMIARRGPVAESVVCD